MRALRSLVASCCLALAACAGGPGAMTCAGDAKPGHAAELLFGRNIGEKPGVSEEDWQGFLDAEVSPRFPEGLTVIDARGQWRDTATGRIVVEPAKLLLLAFFDERQGRAKAGAIVAAYKRRFDQQAVLAVLRPACLSF